MDGPRVASLWLYPIKACGGIPVDGARVTRRGLANDRRYMLVDEAGRFISQREESRLCRVRLAEDGPRGFRAEADGLREGLRLPRVVDGGARATVSVWRSQARDVWVHPEGSEWFSRLLGRPTRLVFMGQAERPVSERYGRPGDRVSFADGFPLLLTNRASLDDLNRRVDRPIEMTRFRPNVVIEGAPAYAEDAWTSLRAGELSFRGPKLCGRCVVTTIDPASGRPGKEPLRTLARYRRRDGEVFFGLNLIPDGEGTLRRGESIQPDRVDETRTFAERA